MRPALLVSIGILLLLVSGCLGQPALPAEDPEAANKAITAFQKANSNFDTHAYTVTYIVNERGNVKEVTETKQGDTTMHIIQAMNNIQAVQTQDQYRYSGYIASLSFVREASADQQVGKLQFRVEANTTQKTVAGRTCDEISLIVEITPAGGWPITACMDRVLGIPLELTAGSGADTLTFSAKSVREEATQPDTSGEAPQVGQCTRLGNFTIIEEEHDEYNTQLVLRNDTGMNTIFKSVRVSGSHAGGQIYPEQEGILDGDQTIPFPGMGTLRISYPNPLDSGAYTLTFIFTYDSMNAYNHFNDIIAQTTCAGSV
ncbi:MAG: hypothetical protein Q8P05_00860 [Candidatus Diapherotrites archaeon]|nr:hypothetical protein [Candidatus Diapherotrites archaeon]MDZ4256108.1 hypothetical protein [archaeon]